MGRSNFTVVPTYYTVAICLKNQSQQHLLLSKQAGGVRLCLDNRRFIKQDSFGSIIITVMSLPPDQMNYAVQSILLFLVQLAFSFVKVGHVILVIFLSKILNMFKNLCK